MVEIQDGLNNRQFALYNYLKKRGDNWTTQERIASDLSNFYNTKDEANIPFHDRAVRHTITNDIRRLNESGLIQKIILSSSKGIKIANKQEFDDYITKNIMSAVRRLKRLKKLSEKANKDGQIKLKINTYERPVIESFIDNLEVEK